MAPPPDPAADGAKGVMGVYREKTLVPREGSPRERSQVKGNAPTGRADEQIRWKGVNIARIVIRVIAWKRIHSSLWISLVVFLAPPFSPVSDATCGRKRRAW